MVMLKTDFDTLMATSALSLDVAPVRQTILEPQPRFMIERQKGGVERLAEVSIFSGLCLMAAVLFVATSSSLMDDRQAWNDGLIALIVAQSAILGGAGLKIYWLMEGNRKVLLRFARSTGHLHTGVRVDTASPPPLPFAPAPSLSIQETAHLAGRKYIMFSDGSIEIDTLLGRRRFTSLDAAREFVGD